MPGFFAAVSSAPPPSLLPRCGACGLHKRCESPKMPVAGRGKLGVLIVGEAPGRSSDLENKPFAGRAGQRLRETLAELGVNLFRDCWATNALICRPHDDGKSRKPAPEEVDHCRPNVLAAIRERQPRTIVLLGAAAVRSVLGSIWKSDPGGIEQWAGFRIPCHEPNAWVCPTYDPADVARMETAKGRANPVPQMFFKRHLAAALGLSSRPWPDGPPNYAGQVETILDAPTAAKTVRQMIDRGGPVAWDIETDRIKPDAEGASIISCSLCWRGKKTISFPWHGEAVEAVREFVRSPQPKIGANNKFETRWIMRMFGHGVRNWVWDTMLAAHAIDNREGITGLKFQSFVQLGQASYTASIDSYMDSDGNNTPNRLREADLPSLLLYGGLDSLLTYKLAELQRERMGVAPW